MSTPAEKSYTPLEQHYQNLISHILDGLLGEEVPRTIELTSYSGKLLIDIEVPDDYRGNIIGKGGCIARSLRTLAEIAPFDNSNHILVNIID